MIKSVLNALASARLSITLLALAMVLVYAGTWAQIDAGTYEIQRRYFHAWITWVPFGVAIPRNAAGHFAIPGGFAMPGGYTIGLFMLLNLLANWCTRFTWKRDKIGIHLIHIGLVLLLLGEAWTSIASVESHMQLGPKQTKAYTEDSHQWELAVIDTSPAASDDVTAIPGTMLRSGETISAAKLPVTLRVDEYAANADILGPMQQTPADLPKATAGSGIKVAMVSRPPSGGVENRVDVPAAYVTVLEGGTSRGTYLLTWGTELPSLNEPQPITLASGQKLALQLRPARHILPFEVQLLEFRHDRFAGTSMARNFSSRVRLVDRERGVDREELIWMNHPLRYRGLTFYQASFQGEDTTVLQVVRNPAMALPYAACAIGAAGLLLQFGIGFLRFNRVRRETQAAGNKRNGQPDESVGFSWGTASTVAVAACSIATLVVWGWFCRVAPYDIAQAPIYVDGRVQPLDSLARNTLRMTNGKASAVAPDGTIIQPMQWLLDGICRPGVAAKYQSVKIDNPEIVGMLSLDASRKRFSPAEIADKAHLIEKQTEDALSTPSAQRDLIQRQLIELNAAMQAYDRATFWEGLRLVPPPAGQQDWHAMGEILSNAQAAGTPPDPLAETVATALTQYQKSPSPTPSVSSAPMVQWVMEMQSSMPATMNRMQLEVFFNRYQPFLLAITMYCLVFVLAWLSMLLGSRSLWRSAMALGIVTLLLHTAAIGMRVYLQGRPPVTNLYSSAVFIGWGAVLLAVLFELLHRNGLVLAMASMVGGASLIVAHNLAQSGDTMGALQAVLDSNFWLTTHVLAITYGYAAVFLAGALGIAYVLGGLLGKRDFAERRGPGIARMIYGVCCFALVFSFVGTILGGIWADQSWGRFWGWDPKENGAVLIVLWLSIMLHARWVGAGDRGLALMAIFANAVTAWSWFGTNMLGVGLHSYGFMDGALRVLLAFVISQLVLIGLGWLLLRPAGIEAIQDHPCRVDRPTSNAASRRIAADRE